MISRIYIAASQKWDKQDFNIPKILRRVSDEVYINSKLRK
jgi:hypothetical protein